MKKLLLLLLAITGSLAATAQNTETAFGKNYWGIRQGFSPASYRFYNGSLYAGPREMNMQLDFIYGFRLNRSFYLETGLSYLNSQRPAFYSFVNYNDIVTENFVASTHGLSIPLGIRYRSGGEKWRFTANTQLVAVGVGLTRTRVRGINNEGQIVQSESSYSAGLGANVMLNLGAGFEYQLAPQWTFRGEVNMHVYRPMLSPNPSFGPSFHFGLFKSIPYGKKF